MGRVLIRRHIDSLGGPRVLRVQTDCIVTPKEFLPNVKVSDQLGHFHVEWEAERVVVENVNKFAAYDEEGRITKVVGKHE